MKILDLLEAINFRSKERSLVIQNGDNFRVGLELEFNTMDEEEFRNSYYEVGLQEYEEILNNEIYSLIENLVEEINNLSEEQLSTLKLIQNSEKPSEIQSSINSLDDLREVRDTIYEIIDYGNSQNSKTTPPSDDFMWNQMADLIFKTSFPPLNSNDFYHIIDICTINTPTMEELEEYWRGGDLSPTIQKLANDADFFLKFIEDVKKKFSRSALIQSDVDAIMDELRSETSFEDSLENFIDAKIKDGEYSFDIDVAIGEVQSYCELNDLDDIIENITDDSSVSLGVEVITIPMTIGVFLDKINPLLKMIDYFGGGTTDRTGLHINISHTSFRTNDIEKVNLLKMIALLDPDFFQNRTHTAIERDIKKKTDKWEERNHMVSALTRVLDTQIEELLEVGSIYGFGEELLKYIEKLLIREFKYRSINFSHAFLGTLPDERRIEFRFPGGTDYQKRSEEIKSDVLFFCYCILIAMDENVGKREYYNGILRMLNRASERSGNHKNFLTAVKEYKSRHTVAEKSEKRFRDKNVPLKYNYEHIVKTWDSIIRNLNKRLRQYTANGEADLELLQHTFNYLFQLRKYDATKSTAMQIYRDGELRKVLNPFINKLLDVLGDTFNSQVVDKYRGEMSFLNMITGKGDLHTDSLKVDQLENLYNDLKDELEKERK